MKKFYKFAVLTVLSLGFFVSCEVGLGSAVDVEAPDLEIQKPETDVVIRDTFALRGDYSDDGTITELTVSLKKTNVKTVAKTYEGTIVPGTEEGKGSWSCVIDPINDGLVDGSYEATVTIVDGGKHKTVQTKTFTIDNTPPIVVLSRPSTKSDVTKENADSYGRTFTLEGQSADENNIDFIEVRIYSDKNCGEDSYLTTVTLNNVPPTIQLDVAKYGDEAYSRIYGDDVNEGTKQYFCTVTAYDSAQRYPSDGSNQNSEDTKGNKTIEFFLYDDIYDDVLSTYKVTELYKMFNGTFVESGDASRAATADTITSKLAAKKLSAGSFSLNPKNNPTFVVSGRNALEGESKFSDDQYSLTNGNSKVTVEVSPGLDKTIIKSDTIGVYLRECDEDGQILLSDTNGVPTPKIWLVKPETATEIDGETVGPEASNQWAGRKIQSGSTYKFTSEKVISNVEYTDLKINKYYRIIVIGQDASGKEIEEDKGYYGFKLGTSGNDKIDLTLSDSEVWLSKASGSSYSHKDLRLSFGESSLRNFDISRATSLSSNNLNDPTVIKGDLAADEWTDRLSAETYDANITLYYQISHNSSIQLGTDVTPSSIRSVKLKVDNTSPKTENLTVTYPSITDTQNSSFAFTGKAKDIAGTSESASGITKVEISFDDSHTRTETVYNNSEIWNYESEIEWNYTVRPKEDSEKFKEDFATEGPKTIYIRATDKMGNVSDWKSVTGFVFDTKAPTLTFDEGTVSTYMPSSGFKISGTATDNYGIKDNKLIIKQTINGSDEKREVTIADDGTWSIAVPFGSDNNTSGTVADTGTYSFEFELKDNAGKTTKETKGSAVDKQAPTITFTDPVVKTGKSAVNETTHQFGGTIGENTGVAAVWYKVSKTPLSGTALNAPSVNLSETAWTEAGWSKGTVGTLNNGTANWSCRYDFTTGTTADNGEGIGYTIYVYAVDVAGNISAATPKTANFDVDMDYPNLDVSITTGANTKIVNSIYYFKGNLHGTVTQSDTFGIKENKYEVSSGSKALSLSGNSFEIPQNEFAEGTTKTLKVTAIDEVGKDTMSTIFVQADNTAPNLGIADLNPYYASAPQIKGTVTDTGAGVAKVQWCATEGGTYADVTLSSNEWTFTPNFTSSEPQGTKKYWFKAIDVVGNETTPVSKEFVYDIADPVISEATIALTDSTKTIKKVGSTYYVKDAFQISGTASDTNKLDRVELVKNLAETKNIHTLKNSDKEADWTKTFTPGTGSGKLADGEYKFDITAYDIATRHSATRTATFIVDTTPPSVPTITSLPGNEETKGRSYTFRGEAEDAGSGIDYVTITISGKDASGNNVVVGPKTVSGKTNWSETVVFGDGTVISNGKAWKDVFATQGEKTVEIVAYDVVGSSNTATETFVYDKENPVLNVDASTVLEFMPASGLVIKGTAYDSYKLKETETLIVTQILGSTTIEKKITIADDKDASGNKTTNATNWSVRVPFDKAGNFVTPTSGEYKYQFELEDSVGNTQSSNQYSTTVDLVAPTLTITSPVSKTGTNSIADTNFRFDGKVTEAQAIAGVFYQIVKPTVNQDGTKTYADPVIPTEGFTIASNWEAKGWTSATSASTQSWSTVQAFVEGASDSIDADTSKVTAYCEGTDYKLYIYAVDKAGNISDANTSTSGNQAYTTIFDVDMKYPVITTKVADVAVNDNTTVTKTSAYTFKYEVSDTVALPSNAVSIVLKKDNVTISPKSIANGVITLPDNSGDGLYTYEISVTDQVGKVTKEVRNIRLDTTPPVITIASPDLTAYQSATDVKITGSSEDASGTNAVYYIFGSTVPATKPTKTDANGWSKAIGTTSWEINVTGAENSEKTLTIVAVDENGLVSTTPTTATVKVDLAPPTSDTSEAALITNKTFTLSGSVYDGNGIKEVVISDGTNTYKPSAKTGNYETALSSGSKATWEQAITITTNRTSGSKSGELSDGIYNFAITTTDKAGKTTTKTKQVTIDTQKPVFNTAEYTATNAVNLGTLASPVYWFGENQIPLNIIVKDTNYASEVTSISYNLDNGSTYYPLSIATTGSESAPTKTSTSSITCSDGINTIYLKAVDNAGNEATTTITDVRVDTTSPLVPTVYKVDGETLVGSKLSNRSKAVDVLLTLADNTTKTTDVAGIDYVMVEGVDSTKVTTVESDGLWKITIPTTSIPTQSGSINILVADKVGHTNTTPFAFTIDTNKPTLKLAALEDADTDTTITDINKTVKLEVTVTDDNGFNNDDIVLKYYTKATAGASYGTTGTEIELNKSATPWTCEFDTTTDALKTTPYIKFELTGKDKAGNAGDTVTQEYLINQDSDRPKITLTNLGLNGMTSSAPVYLKGLSTIYGQVSDDDGSIKELYYSKNSGTNWTSLSVSNSGSFSITNLADGPYKLMFKVVDKNPLTNASGTTFISSTTSGPKLIGSDNQKFTTDTQLYMRVDTTNPTMDVLLQPYTKSGSNYEAKGSPVQLGATCVVGGVTKNAIEFILSAKDTNGIKGISLKLEGKSATDESDLVKYYRSNGTITESGVTTWITASTPVTATTDNSEYKWTTDKIDLSMFKAGSVKVKAVVYDNAELTTQNNSEFTIDNTAPSFDITAPSADGNIIYGSQSNTVGGMVKQGTTDVEEILYVVSSHEGTVSDAITETWTKVDGQTMSASIIFDGNKTSTENGKHDDTLHDYIAKLFYPALSASDDVPDATKDIYVHFKAIDSCGNEGISTRKIKVIPNGDKPTVSLSYPTEDGKSLAGTIRLYGNAEIVVGEISAVYVQIDPSFDTTFSSTWDTDDSNLVSNNYSVVTIPGTTEKGIKANGTNNWNLPINSNKEFNLDSGNRDMAIRIYAVNANTTRYKASDYVERTLTIDANAPHIGGNGTGEIPIQLVQFQSGNEGDLTIENGKFKYVTKQMSYTSEMWVRGKWYLIASVSDNSGIKKISLDENISGTDKIWLVGDGTNSPTNDQKINNVKTSKLENCIVVQNTSIDSNDKNFNICIPLATQSGSGTIKYTIEATEYSEYNNSCSETFTVNFDNQAPKLGTDQHEKYGINASVVQSNGFYTLNSYATDATTGSDERSSGMMGVAFYFVRRGTAATNPVTKVYDPMFKDKSVTIRTGENDASNITYGEGLYWQTKTVVRNTTDLTELKLSSALGSVTPDNSNIHIGGLVKLGGTIYRIKDVDNTNKKVYVDGTPPVTLTTAEFALALVVDNIGKTETSEGRTKLTGIANKDKYGYGYYSASSSADDGDLMQENWVGTSVEGQWQAMINSANIPDGPIEIHYVAFDKAQNYSVGIVGNVDLATYKNYGTLDVTENATLESANSTANNLASRFVYSYADANKAYVSNNAPRLSGVTIATDTNGNGTIEDSEKLLTYHNIKTINNWSEAVTTLNVPETGATSVLKIKGRTELYPEIIGGNGEIKYNYKVSKRNTGNTDWEAAYTGNSTLVKLGEQTTEQAELTDGDNKIVITVKDFLTKRTAAGTVSDSGKEIEDAENQKFTFTIWDSTEETTCGSNSQYATMNVVMDVALRDTTKPKNVIFPFYWNSKDDNSLFGQSTANGHIELEGDLPAAFTNGGSGIMDRDPKVSGKIKLEGLASDNVVLTQLLATLGNKASAVIATYDVDNQKWYKGTTTSGESAVVIGEIDSIDNSETKGQWVFTDTLSSGAIPNDGFAIKLSLPTYADLKQAGLITTIPTGKTAATTVDQFTAEYGHVIKWTIYVDTANTVITTNVAAADQVFSVSAKDKGKPSLNNGNVVYNNATSTTNPTVQTSATTATGKYQIDVVPYVTKVTTSLSKGKYPSANSRTANGHYTVRAGETITFTGFNLTDAKFVKKEAVGTNPAIEEETVDLGTGGTLVTTADNIATSGSYRLKVSDVYSLNNMNKNDAKGSYSKEIESDNKTGDKDIYDNYYNRQPNGYNNNRLTDDLILDVWEFNSQAAIPISGKLEQPIMKINPSTDQIGFAFAHGVYFSMPGIADSASNDSDADKSESSYNYWIGSYDFFTSVEMAYDKNGRSYALAAGGDMNMDGAADRFSLMSSRFGHETRYQTGSANANRRIESIAMRNTSGTVTFEKQRVKSPSMVTTVNGNDKTNIYMAYFDQKNAEIRYLYGQEGADEWFDEYTDFPIEFFDGINNNAGFAHVKGNSIKSCFNGLNGDKVQILDAQKNLIKIGDYDINTKFYAYFNNGDGKDNWANRTLNSTVANVRTPASPYQNVTWTCTEPGMYNWVGITTERRNNQNNIGIPVTAAYIRVYKHKTIQDFAVHGYTYYSDYNGQVISSSNTNFKPGQYVSIAVDEASGRDVVVLVWYDESEENQCLWYSYNETPKTDRKGHTITGSNYNENGWSTPERVFATTSDYNQAGKYCQITVDANHGIHIAAFDSGNSELVYAYRKSYKYEDGFTTCLVDGNGNSPIGEYLTLDVALDSSNRAMPQIGYYSAGKPKYATVTTAGVFEDGTINDEFTGAWECSFVPTNKTIYTQSMQYNKINVGVWKNSSGQIKASVSGSSRTENTENGYASTSYGYCWGNGTSNAVLGYAVDISSESNAIETAQMK